MKLGQALREHAWLMQGAKAAEKYQKSMLDEGRPPNTTDAAAAAIAAQDRSLRELMD